MTQHTPQDSQSALKEAIKKDFHKLYVKQFTVDWEVQRLVRDTEVDVMSLDNLESYVTTRVKEAYMQGFGEGQNSMLYDGQITLITIEEADKRVKEAVDNYHKEITADETKVWISRTDFEQRLKEAERLARVDELDKLLRQDDLAGIPLYQGWKKRSIEWRIRELTTTTNGKED